MPHSLTGDNDVDSITSGYYWVLDSSRTLNWSLSNGFKGESWANPIQSQLEISQALNFVSYYADIKFNYTARIQKVSATVSWFFDSTSYLR